MKHSGKASTTGKKYNNKYSAKGEVNFGFGTGNLFINAGPVEAGFVHPVFPV